MNCYDNIKQKLINNEINRKVNYYSFYNVGKMLNDTGKHYDEGIIKEYSKRLTNDLGKGYTFTSLTRMKKLYLLLKKLATVSQQLSYGHYVELLLYDEFD